MEAIELYESHTAEVKEHLASGGSRETSPLLPPLMVAHGAKSPEEYMAKMIFSVRSSEVEQTLLVLPFDVVVRLLGIMETLLSRRGFAAGSTEAMCRMFLLLVEAHFGPLSVSEDLHPLVSRVRQLADVRLGDLRNSIGFNIAALEFARNRRDERKAALELEESVTRVKTSRRKTKSKEKAMQAAVLTL